MHNNENQPTRKSAHFPIIFPVIIDLSRLNDDVDGFFRNRRGLKAQVFSTSKWSAMLPLSNADIRCAAAYSNC
jgi:hypothetical protein